MRESDGRGARTGAPIRSKHVRTWFLGLSLWLVFVVTPAGAQTTKAPLEVLTNRTVIEMVNAHLPDELILAKIGSSQSSYDVTTAGLMELTKAKVPMPIIKAMMAQGGGGSAPVVVPAPAVRSGMPASVVSGAAAFGEPDPPAEPGVYILGDSLGARVYVQIEAAAYSQGKTGGWLKSAITYGIAKTTIKAVVRGETSNVQASNDSPVFYFVFENTKSSLSNAGGFFGGVTSPNEFTLIRLKVTEGSRETTVMSSNIFGTQSGASDKSVVPFSFTKVRPGIYRVAPKSKLDAGEYGFISAAGFSAPMVGVGSNRLWDFTVR